MNQKHQVMTEDEKYDLFFENVWKNKPYSIDLQKFEEIVKAYEEGKITFCRYPEAISNWLKEGSRPLKSAALLLKGCPRTVSEIREIYAYSDISRNDGLEQEEILEAWAKAAGIWIDNPEQYFSEISSYMDSGSECLVYYDSNRPVVHKIMTLKNYNVPKLAIDRIVIHNYLFVSTELSITGFSRDKNGNFVILVNQPLAYGRRSTQEERDGLMKSLHFKSTNNGCGVNFENDDLFVGDLHEENIMVVDSENEIIDFYVIDSDCRINSPSLGENGKFSIPDYSKLPPKHDSSTDQGFSW